MYVCTHTYCTAWKKEKIPKEEEKKRNQIKEVMETNRACNLMHTYGRQLRTKPNRGIVDLLLMLNVST